MQSCCVSVFTAAVLSRADASTQSRVMLPAAVSAQRALSAAEAPDLLSLDTLHLQSALVKARTSGVSDFLLRSAQQKLDAARAAHGACIRLDVHLDAPPLMIDTDRFERDFEDAQAICFDNASSPHIGQLCRQSHEVSEKLGRAVTLLIEARTVQVQMRAQKHWGVARLIERAMGPALLFLDTAAMARAVDSARGAGIGEAELGHVSTRVLDADRVQQVARELAAAYVGITPMSINLRQLATAIDKAKAAGVPLVLIVPAEEAWDRAQSAQLAHQHLYEAARLGGGVDAIQRALEEARAAGVPDGMLPDFARLSQAGATLDEQLLALSSSGRRPTDAELSALRSIMAEFSDAAQGVMAPEDRARLQRAQKALESAEQHEADSREAERLAALEEAERRRREREALEREALEREARLAREAREAREAAERERAEKEREERERCSAGLGDEGNKHYEESSEEEESSDCSHGDDEYRSDGSDDEHSSDGSAWSRDGTRRRNGAGYRSRRRRHSRNSHEGMEWTRRNRSYGDADDNSDEVQDGKLSSLASGRSGANGSSDGACSYDMEWGGAQKSTRLGNDAAFYAGAGMDSFGKVLHHEWGESDQVEPTRRGGGAFVVGSAKEAKATAIGVGDPYEDERSRKQRDADERRWRTDRGDGLGGAYEAMDWGERDDTKSDERSIGHARQLAQRQTGGERLEPMDWGEVDERGHAKQHTSVARPALRRQGEGDSGETQDGETWSEHELLERGPHSKIAARVQDRSRKAKGLPELEVPVEHASEVARPLDSVQHPPHSHPSHLPNRTGHHKRIASPPPPPEQPSMHGSQNKQRPPPKAPSMSSKVSASRLPGPAAVVVEEKEAATKNRRPPKQRTPASDQPRKTLLATSKEKVDVKRTSRELSRTPPTTPALAAPAAANAKAPAVFPHETRPGQEYKEKVHEGGDAQAATGNNTKDPRTRLPVVAVEAPASTDELVGGADQATQQQEEGGSFHVADPPAVATTTSTPLELTAQSHAPTPDLYASRSTTSVNESDSVTAGGQRTLQPGTMEPPSLSRSPATSQHASSAARESDHSLPPPTPPLPSPLKLDACPPLTTHVDAPAKRMEHSPLPVASAAPPPAMPPVKLRMALPVTPPLEGAAPAEVEDIHAKSERPVEDASGMLRMPTNEAPWSPPAWVRTPTSASRRNGLGAKQAAVLHGQGKPEQEMQVAPPVPSPAKRVRPVEPLPSKTPPASSASSAAPASSATPSLGTVEAPMASISSCAREASARRPINMSASFSSATLTPDERPPAIATASERPSVSRDQACTSEEMHPDFGALTHAEERALRIPSPPPRKYLPKPPRTYYHANGRPQRWRSGAPPIHSPLAETEPFLPKLGHVDGFTEPHASSQQPPRPIDSPERLLAKLPRRMLSWHESEKSLSPFAYSPFAVRDEPRATAANSPSSIMPPLSLVSESARGCAQRAGRLKLGHVDRWSTFTRSRSDPSFVPRS